MSFTIWKQLQRVHKIVPKMCACRSSTTRKRFKNLISSENRTPYVTVLPGSIERVRQECTEFDSPRWHIFWVLSGSTASTQFEMWYTFDYNIIVRSKYINFYLKCKLFHFTFETLRQILVTLQHFLNRWRFR